MVCHRSHHPAPTQHRGAGTQPGTDHRREGIGIETGEHPPERRIIRCPTHAVAGRALAAFARRPISPIAANERAPAMTALNPTASS